MTMEKERKIKDKFLASLEMPPLAVGDCASIELSGNTCASIEGCRGIVEYSGEKIVLSLGGMSASFCGTGLEIASFDGENALVSGTFYCVEFN